MNKYIVALIVAAMMPASVAFGYESGSASEYTVSRPGKVNSYKNTSTVRKSGGYGNTIQNNFYYSQPTTRRATSSRAVMNNATTRNYNPDYGAGYIATRDSGYKGSYNTKQTTTTKTSRSTQERKYFLAHPFFQPLEGRFSSSTDISYGENNFKFDMLSDVLIRNLDLNSTHPGETISASLAQDISGKVKTTQFIVKEDVGFGITDKLAVVLTGVYDSTELKLKDWTGEQSGPVNSKDSGLNIFGAGLQYRIVDNTDWIATMAGFYQYQKDTANTFIAELKGGYKINRTTIYGIGRLGYSKLTDGDMYGALFQEGTGDWLMMAYKTDVDSVMYVEGGAGVFAVMNKYVTLNGEMLFGNYDWHNQLSIKGAIGFQPRDMFALNLYASGVLYDSAKNKTKTYINYDVNPDAAVVPSYFSGSTALETTGSYKIKDYNEYKVGIQAILYF